MLHFVFFPRIEYNEMNFQQEVAIGDGDECSNALGIVHISFEEKAKSADISEEPIEIVSTKSECRQKDKCDKHGKPNVVHINQNEFLKVKFNWINSIAISA